MDGNPDTSELEWIGTQALCAELTKRTIDGLSAVVVQVNVKDETIVWYPGDPLLLATQEKALALLTEARDHVRQRIAELR